MDGVEGDGRNLGQAETGEINSGVLMSRRNVVSVNLDNLNSLPDECRCCGYWESAKRAVPGRDSYDVLAKEHWYNLTLSQWGECGRLLVQDDQTLGYIQYGPSAYFPQLKFSELGPISVDAIFLACLFIPTELRGQGLSKLLLSSVEKDLFKRGFRALETISRRAPDRNPSGWTEFFLASGFKILREQGSLALMRLDLKTALPWQENLEAMLDSLPLVLPRKIKVKVPIPS